MMRHTALALPAALAGMFGFAAHAQAQPAIWSASSAHLNVSSAQYDDPDEDDTADDADDEDEAAPDRPGGNTHFPRNGITHDDDTVAPDDDDAAPDRPGAKTHFPRNATKLDNSGHPVTGQGPNKGTKPLNDTLDAAGGKHHC
ncbi:hypothetical protein Srot_0121 [Segniliparus rotundus DSM 44985]|uniref:Uncharacterized protein n=1 Tax=Segniliparus rotundus (strain ATCC BAA-972 / CDC 1076 / CIP 108378 / DSM 44985 / JCM 13578) TaxID=640132 RepID=D6ZA70_SEGRD|nr:hypothetical protein [Segniliparus rotundus]ADG96612.1 hypothetical protein Srot_0121 [Segniliparus rotundus DSM 44985]